MLDSSVVEVLFCTVVDYLCVFFFSIANGSNDFDLCHHGNGDKHNRFRLSNVKDGDKVRCKYSKMNATSSVAASDSCAVSRGSRFDTWCDNPAVSGHRTEVCLSLGRRRQITEKKM